MKLHLPFSKFLFAFRSKLYTHPSLLQSKEIASKFRIKGNQSKIMKKHISWEVPNAKFEPSCDSSTDIKISILLFWTSLVLGPGWFRCFVTILFAGSCCLILQWCGSCWRFEKTVIPRKSPRSFSFINGDVKEWVFNWGTACDELVQAWIHVRTSEAFPHSAILGTFYGGTSI